MSSNHNVLIFNDILPPSLSGRGSFQGRSSGDVELKSRPILKREDVFHKIEKTDKTVEDIRTHINWQFKNFLDTTMDDVFDETIINNTGKLV